MGTDQQTDLGIKAPTKLLDPKSFILYKYFNGISDFFLILLPPLQYSMTKYSSALRSSTFL